MPTWNKQLHNAILNIDPATHVIHLAHDARDRLDAATVVNTIEAMTGGRPCTTDDILAASRGTHPEFAARLSDARVVLIDQPGSPLAKRSHNQLLESRTLTDSSGNTTVRLREDAVIVVISSVAPRHRTYPRVFTVDASHAEPASHERAWDNALIAQVASILTDRDEPDAEHLISWLHENESSDMVWREVQRFIGSLTELSKLED